MFEVRPYNRNRRSNEVFYDPFRAMNEFEKRFFDEPFGRMFEDHAPGFFRTDISDRGDNFLLEADLPGFNKKDIRLDLNGDTLTITAERHSEREDKDKKGSYLCSERSYGSFSRSYDVSAVDTDNIRAKYEDGVLKLYLPKKAEILPSCRTLEIE